MLQNLNLRLGVRTTRRARTNPTNGDGRGGSRLHLLMAAVLRGASSDPPALWLKF